MIRYNKKELNVDIQMILKTESNVYGQAMALETYLKASKLKNVNTFLCMACLEWKSGKATNFEEDIISFGGSALHWLKKARKLDAENTSIQKYISSVEKAIAKAEKRTKRKIKNILEVEAQDLETLKASPFLSEIAFYYYSRSTRSKESAEKCHRYYLYLYKREIIKDPTNESLLYYWDALTSCKFLAEGYLASVEEVKKLQDWKPMTSQYVYKDAISNGYWHELYHCSTINNLVLFRNVFVAWQEKMEAIIDYRGSNDLVYKRDLLMPICVWLLSQDRTVNDLLESIIKKCEEEFITKEDLKLLAQIEEKLKEL